MKAAVLLLPLLSLTAISCQQSMPAVPPSTRAVVGPRGSSDNAQPWSRTTRQEGEAALGPLGNSERR